MSEDGDWADRLAQQIVDTPGIIQVWDKAGYCNKCNHPLSGSLMDLSLLKKTLAETFREIKEVNR